MMGFERYSNATHSANLAMSDWRTLDVDWVAAAGACQIHGDPLPAQVARWLAGDHKNVFYVLASLQKRYGRTRTLTCDARDDIVDAMQWWHDRTCKDCGGRGHRQIADTPMMEEADCACCGGTGMAGHSRSSAAYTFTLRALDTAAAVCGAAVTIKVA